MKNFRSWLIRLRHGWYAQDKEEATFLATNRESGLHYLTLIELIDSRLPRRIIPRLLRETRLIWNRFEGRSRIAGLPCTGNWFRLLFLKLVPSNFSTNERNLSNSTYWNFIIEFYPSLNSIDIFTSTIGLRFNENLVPIRWKNKSND